MLNEWYSLVPWISVSSLWKLKGSCVVVDAKWIFDKMRILWNEYLTKWGFYDLGNEKIWWNFWVMGIDSISKSYLRLELGLTKTFTGRFWGWPCVTFYLKRLLALILIATHDWIFSHPEDFSEAHQTFQFVSFSWLFYKIHRYMTIDL